VWELDAREKAALRLVPEDAWQIAIDHRGQVRERRADGACTDTGCGHRDRWIEEAYVSELTGLLREGPGGDQLKGWPAIMRIFARRERPHPGAKLSLFEHEDGYRYQLWVPNLPADTRGWRGQNAYIDAGHRVHARVEDAIRTGKDTGIPSRRSALDPDAARALASMQRRTAAVVRSASSFLNAIAVRRFSRAHDLRAGVTRLTDREKILLCLVADVCRQRLGLPFERHVRAAAECGVDADDLRELLRFIAYDSGYPAALAALDRLVAIERAHGLPGPARRRHEVNADGTGSPIPAPVRDEVHALDAPFGRLTLAWRGLVVLDALLAEVHAAA
jgi:alkylhydroperoxidase/carboxymuconolactone decarboxylase family protein YurZ